MKSRSLYISIFFIAVVGVFGALAYTGVVPLPILFQNIPTGTEKVSYQPVKVKRAAGGIENASFSSLMAEGDEAAFAGNLSRALESYQKASELLPRAAAPYEKIGDISLAEKNYVAARQNFSFALTLEGAASSTSLKHVRSLLGLRKIFDAKAALEKIQPQTSEAQYYSGLLAAFLNEQEKAKDLLQKSLAALTDPALKKNAQTMLNVYRDFELARASDLVYLQALLVRAFDTVGEYGLAIELGFNTIKKEPNYRDVWIVMGHAFLNEGKYDDAQDSLTKALDLDATSASAYFFRGLALKNKGSIQQALQDIGQAEKLGWQPRVITMHERAELYFAQKDFERAYPLYAEVVRLDSSDINRFVRPIALAINHLNKEKEAFDLAKLAYEKHPGTAVAESLLGWVLLANGDFQSSREHLKEALRKDPELESALLNMGMLDEEEGNKASALENYKKALTIAQKKNNQTVGETAAARYNDVLSGRSTGRIFENNTLNEKKGPIPSLNLL